MYIIATIYYSVTNSLWAASQPLWHIVINLNNTKWNFLFLLWVYLLLQNFFTKHYCVCILAITYSIVSKYSQADCVPQLLVGYNNIHPLLFYSATILLCSLNTPFENISKSTNLTVFVIGVCSLILGGYWGLNNTAWGYFWVNDFIEVILLAICTLALIQAHLRKCLGSRPVNFLVLIYIVSLIVGSRYGLVFTRHSFFDVTKITNVSTLYPLTICKVHYLIVLKILSLTINCILFLALICAIKTVSIQAFQSLYLLLLHVVVLILVITWLKQVPLHYSKAAVKQLYLLTPVFLYKGMVGFLFQFSKYKTIVYSLTSTLFLHQKVYVLKPLAIVLFSSLIYLTFWLLSITKIYANYVQN